MTTKSRATIFYVTVGDLVALGLYLVQQLGVMLGVGAATITLVAHLVSSHDGVVDPTEARFARFIERVLMVGLLCIIVSGVVITAFHSLSGEAGIIFTPAYLFKWLLIAVVALPLIVGHKHPFPPVLFAGFIGATWYALFLLHVTAPNASWVDIVLLYIVWVAAFLVLWATVARLFNIKVFTFTKKISLSLPAPKVVTALVAPKPVVQPIAKPVLAPKPIVVSVTAPAPKPVPSPAPIVKAPLPPQKPVVVAAAPAPHKPHASPAPHKPAELPPAHAMLPVPVQPAPQKPTEAVLPVKLPQKPEEKAEDSEQYSELPTIRVMPRTPEDVDKQLRATVVQFN